MNPRSTDCEADALTTTPSHRLTVIGYLLLKRAGLQNNVILPATCLLENAVRYDKKAVFAASL